MSQKLLLRVYENRHKYKFMILLPYKDITFNCIKRWYSKKFEIK
jgi:hypothetical protein